jgi:hypothetical protein
MALSYCVLSLYFFLVPPQNYTIMITGQILAVAANGINWRRHSPRRTTSTRVDPRLDPNVVPLLPRYMVYEENNENHHFVECFVGREGNTQVAILGDLGMVSTIVLDYAGGACSFVARDTRVKPLSYLVQVHWVVGRCDLHLLNLNPPWMWLVPNDNDYQSIVI